MNNLERLSEAAEEKVADYCLVFATPDEHDAPLFPGGGDVGVTAENRAEYIGSVHHWIEHQFDEQIAAIRAGIGCVMPVELLRLLAWEELEVMVVGVAEWEVKELRDITEYEGCSESQPHIQLFWQALESFDQVRNGNGYLW
jgi:hypothetical protein